MKPGHISSPGMNPAALRGMPDEISGKDHQDPAAKLTYAKRGVSSGRGLEALQRATDAGTRLNEGKTKSRSLMHELALSFRCAVRDLIDSVRDSLRSATRTTPAKAPPASAAAVAPKGPNADCATSVKTLSGVLANDVKTMGLQCTAIPKLLHDIFAGRDFTQIRGDDLTKSMPANSHQESRLVLRVLAFMQNPPATDVDGKADLGRDETIVRITQQLATLLPDDVKARCAPLLDGLGTANFSERGPKLAALLQAPVGQ